jgi:hypothetical protein
VLNKGTIISCQVAKVICETHAMIGQSKEVKSGDQRKNMSKAMKTFGKDNPDHFRFLNAG